MSYPEDYHCSKKYNFFYEYNFDFDSKKDIHYNLFSNEEENSYNPDSESEELSDSFKSKDINNEEKNNPEKLHDGNALDVPQAKNEVLLLENGTYITTSNALQKEVLNKYLRSTEVKEEETVGIQLSKRKRKRRTKKEVLKKKI